MLIPPTVRGIAVSLETGLILAVWVNESRAYHRRAVRIATASTGEAAA